MNTALKSTQLLLEAEEIRKLRNFLEENRSLLGQGLFIGHNEAGELDLRVKGVGSLLADATTS